MTTLSVRSTSPRFQEILRSGVRTLYYVPTGMTGTVSGIDVDSFGERFVLVHWDWTACDRGSGCEVVGGGEVVSDVVPVGELVWAGGES